MCDKQLGAAPEAETEPVKGPGWFARLRAQPGFKTAAVAFVLTVILGVGGPAAYAYWSDSTSVSISGKTVRPPLPTLQGDVRCGWNGSRVVISQPTPVSALPGGASVVMRISDPKGTTYYTVSPREYVRLIDVPGLEDRLRWGNSLSISYATAYLNGNAAPNIGLVQETDLLDFKSLAWTKEASAYYRASFFCER
ncbi:hypothetical protein [Arthrobacter zhaoxinii]|uniref:hypothetical protein n=1 Tax=Arthrobacter zhaoxinii TaxID=2964616 RepID=UPI00210623EB|nr:hypothetical protein [Arthrobacter zhaoxinii]MCQ2001789.1 hypothetical protein [Arthrobacter zhaoxinii]